MKKVFLEKRKEVIAIFLATILTISLSCSSGSSYNGGLGGTDIVTFDQVKTEIERGLESTLRSPQGLLYTSTTDKSFLSETIGLEMLWRVMKEDKNGFDKQLALLKKYFISPIGLLYWKLSTTLKPSNANASIDDLRVCKALILAYRKWGDPDYFNTAKTIADGLLKYCVKDYVLLDGASWQKGGVYGGVKVTGVTPYITLSYPDLETMMLLKEINGDWLKVAQRTAGIVLFGAVLKEGDVYWEYDITKENFFDAGEENLINVFLHLFHLANIGSVPIKNISFWASKIKTENGIYINGVDENIAVYALAGLAFHYSGFVSEADFCIKRMLDFRLNDGLLGYLIDGGQTSAWAFDNLLALIAIEMISKGKEGD